MGGAVALLQARRMLAEGRYARIIVAGVDTFLTGATLAAYGREDRLLRRDNSNGFIPGEAAGAVLLAGMAAGWLVGAAVAARASASRASRRRLDRANRCARKDWCRRSALH